MKRVLTNLVQRRVRFARTFRKSFIVVAVAAGLEAEVIFEELVHAPRDCCRRRLIQQTSCHALKIGYKSCSRGHVTTVHLTAGKVTL